ncbi:AraC family transcriptional regulator [Thiomicrorhabdus sp.]|uniref:AraC family transcriptional regulator n=1 Tax=Thiomicrorhabdus sp. TaxID=2039724 RepID=UPI0029C88852|nr:AraC family transcriptional regulator [Thiomicrorhabdus sp.]
MKNRRYQQSIDAVCDHIYRHLDEPLTVEELSEIANFSKYHFHRLFAASVGVNVSRFIQLLRLKRASYQLVFDRDQKIIDIAFSVGYDSAEAFHRAFKKNFGVSPSEFRKQPVWSDWHDQYQFKMHGRDMVMQLKDKVEVIDFPEIKIAVFEHSGSPLVLNDSIAQFIDWRKNSGLSPIKTSRTFGVPFNDPNMVEPEAFCFDICGEVKQTVPENPQGVINKVIPAGRCAKIRHIGSRDHLDDKIYYLYREWLGENDESTRDFPVFFEYLNFFPEVAEHEQITDIYLPLVG